MPVLHVWVKVGTHFSFFLFLFKGNVIRVYIVYTLMNQ